MRKSPIIQAKLLADIAARYGKYNIFKPVGTQNVKTFLHLMLKLGK